MELGRVFGHFECGEVANPCVLNQPLSVLFGSKIYLRHLMKSLIDREDRIDEFLAAGIWFSCSLDGFVHNPR